MILGFDISTSVVGICLLDDDGSLKRLSYIDLRKTKSFWEKAEKTKESINALKESFDKEFGPGAVESVLIEENLSKFRPGFSSAQTLLTLARFNGIVSYIIVLAFGLDVEYINVNEARRLASIKIDRKDKNTTTKEKVFAQVSPRVSFQWITKIVKSGPSVGTRRLDDCNFDMCDAWVIATAGLKKQHKLA